MRCEQARQLFDAYLDGELSPALETELGAHRLRCADCRRELALLEVTGHVLRSDSHDVTTTEDFTDRLLKCVEEASRPRWIRLRRLVYIGGPIAAAAVIALAFVGFFDGKGASKVAGVQEVNPAVVRPAQPPPAQRSPARATVTFEEWLRQTEQNVESGRRTGESLQNVLDTTFSQMLDMLEESAEPASEAKSVEPDSSPSAGEDGEGADPADGVVDQL